MLFSQTLLDAEESGETGSFAEMLRIIKRDEILL